MTQPTTTGVVATWNQRDYVADAVRGLADQADEVIVVDDCSTDGTWELLRELAGPTVRVFRNERQSGVSATYSRAVDEATSEILLIQGGDDHSLPGRAAAQAEALSDSSVALAYSLPVVIDATGAALPGELASEFLAGAGDPDPLTFLFFEANYLCAPSVAVRRSDYLRLGGFRRGIDLLQDYELWLALAAEGSFLRLEAPVVEYRKHGSNLSREYSALDSPKERRLAAEMDTVRRRFLDRADAATRERLALACGLEPAGFRAHDAAEQEMLIQLSHRDKTVVRHGLDTLFDIAGGADGPERLHRLGLDYDDLARFSTIADPTGLAEVARAFSLMTGTTGDTATGR